MTALTLALTSHVLAQSPPVSMGVWRVIRPQVSLGPEAVRQVAEQHLKPVDHERVSMRLDLLSEAEAAIERLEALGILVVTEFDSRYPSAWLAKLRDRHPALVFVAGSPQVLNHPMVGIVGSRDVDDEGSRFASDVSAEAVRLGFGVASGGARGVDQISMRAAYEAGGYSVGILADSLLRTVRQPATQEALDSGRVCLLTPYAPDAPFNAGNAMNRNRLIYSLSDASVVVASALGTGGTWNGAVKCLDQRLSKLLVWPGLAGNEALISRGGIRLDSPDRLGPAMDEDPPEMQPSLL